jgi:CP family cyanate transporter-like MFS transporter
MLAHRNARMQFDAASSREIRVGSAPQDPRRVEGARLIDRPSSLGAGPAVPPLLIAFVLFWLAGMAIRLPLLAIPPVIPLMHDDLHMSETQVGALVGMPLIMFALAAVPGSLLIARFGVMAIAVTALFITALAGAARGAAPNVWILYVATILVGFGIAILQPAMPTLVRAWAPHRLWLGNAIYTNGMMIGAMLGPALTIPLVLPLLGGSWRYDLALWAVPGLLAALAYMAAALRTRSPAAPAADAPKRRWPDWNSPQLWLLGITLGANNAQFFATNAFIPDYLTSTGRGDLIGTTLGWLNGAQLMASFFMLAVSESAQRKTWPFVVFGPLTLLATIGVVLGEGIWLVASAAVLGFAASVTFVVMFGLPAILARPDDVHRMAGGMFTISYTIAVIVPIICGALWDLTGLPWMAFVPIALCGLVLAVAGTALTLRTNPG